MLDLSKINIKHSKHTYNSNLFVGYVSPYNIVENVHFENGAASGLGLQDVCNERRFQESNITCCIV